jgi:glycosyltransferase involved in cell wall biosynthesis
MTQSVYILIPVHNRKAITLACLGHLRNLGAIDRYPIIIIDDGSTDGTAAAIRQSYPAMAIFGGPVASMRAWNMPTTKAQPIFSGSTTTPFLWPAL